MLIIKKNTKQCAHTHYELAAKNISLEEWCLGLALLVSSVITPHFKIIVLNLRV